jgi:hypothetical protein
MPYVMIKVLQEDIDRALRDYRPARVRQHFVMS